MERGRSGNYSQANHFNRGEEEIAKNGSSNRMVREYNCRTNYNIIEQSKEEESTLFRNNETICYNLNKITKAQQLK